MPISSIAPTPILIGSLLVEIVLAIGLTLALTRRRWPKSRTIYVAASPLPGVIIALCIYVFISAATASKESCGVDACGMAMAAAVVLTSTAMILYVFGLIVAWVTMRFLGPSEGDDFKDTFR